MFKIINQIKKNFVILLCLLSILLGIILRLYNLNFENLWNDEIFTFWVTDPKITLKETFSRLNSSESIPALHFFLIKNLHMLFGYSPDVGRYFSAFFGILSIFSIGYMSKQISNNKSYLFTIFLISLNIFLISYSQESRVYIFSFFLVSLNLIYFLKLYKEQFKKKFSLNFILFNIFQILAILSFPYAIIIFLSILSFTVYEYIFFKKKNFKINISLFISFIFLCVYLPYYINTVPLSVDWLMQPDLKFYTNFYFTKFFGSRIMGLTHLILLISFIMYFYKKIFYKNNYYIFLIIIIFLIYFLPILYGYIVQPAIHERYIIFVLIPLIILLSSLIFEIKNKKLKSFFIIFFVVITFGNHFTESTFKQFFEKKDLYKPNFLQTFKFIDNSKYKNVYFDLSKFNKDSKNFIFYPYKNYSNYLTSSNDIKINILDNNSDLLNLKGFWSICLFGLNGCNFKHDEFIIVETKNFTKLTIKLYEKKIK